METLSVPNARLKILFITSRLPYPLDKGDKLRAFHQIQELSKIHDVYLISMTDEDISKTCSDALLPITKQFHTARISSWSRCYQMMCALFSSLPFQTAWFYSDTIKKYIFRQCDEIKPDVIFCQLARTAEYLPDRQAIKILDYMDAFGVGMDRRSAISTGLTKWIYRQEAARMMKYEETISSKFDQLIIISTADKDQLNFERAREIHVIPNGIDEMFFEYPPIQKSIDVIFVGNMSYLPNIEAAEYLIQKIMPVCSSDLKVEIAGTSPHPRVRQLERSNIIVSGFMNDIRDAYARGKIFCAPLWSGTGQQNKILEAMAMGIPCITTNSVNSAIGAEHGREILIAENPSEFAQAIELLQTDERLYKSISERARQFVKDKYQWSKVGKELSNMMIKRQNN